MKKTSILVCIFLLQLQTLVWSISLEDSLRRARQNHALVKVAERQLELQRIKQQEALRAIFPTLSLSAEETKGKSVQDLGVPSFTERNYGARVSQVLFQGGKLWNTYLQARANSDLYEVRYKKALQEVIFDVQEAYWSWVKSHNVVQVYQVVLQDLQQEEKRANKLFAQEAIAKQIQMTVSSQLFHAQQNHIAALADEQAQLWKWVASLGLYQLQDERPSLPSTFEEVKEISLEDCLAIAEKNNPEILEQKYAFEVARLGKKISANIYWPQIDVNGFYGSSGSAFQNEKFNWQQDWQLGVKASLYFFGNTLGSSTSQQKTSPKLGQSSRTETETIAVNVGLLDALKSRSDRAESKVIYDQAEYQMQKVRMDVLNKVRQSYADLKKAQAQIKIAETDLTLSKMELAIAQIKVSRQEAIFSERALARSKLAQAQIAYEEARALLQIALATLYSSMGILKVQ